PDAVTTLNIPANNTSPVSLTWSPPQENSSYSVEQTNGTVSNSTTTPNSPFTVTDLTPGVKYTFNVTAVSAVVETSGAPVQTSVFTNPNVITNLIISARSTSSVSLTWSPPQGNYSFYTIQWTNKNVSNSTTTPNSTFTVTDLTPGVKYTFNVTAVAADNITSEAPVQISTFTIPDVVTNLSISAHTTSSVSLTWTPPHGQSSFYTVQWTDGTVSNSTTTPNSSFTVTDLTPGVNYTFNVTAVAADNITSGAPVQISRVTNPNVVTNLIISAHTTSSVSLTWSPPQGNYSFYTIEWTNGTVSNSTTTPNSSFTVTDLTPGVNYTFSVTAVAADNITSGAPVQISRVTNPDIVTGLTASSTNTSVSLTWTPPRGQSSSYTVWWTNGTVSNNNTTQSTSYTVTDLSPGVKYTFNVTAVAADNITSGAPVQISRFTNPNVVTNLIISSYTTSSVSLTWTPPQGNFSSYTIEWTNVTVSNSSTTLNTSYTVTNLTPGVKYTFSVTAVAGDNITSEAPVQISTFTIPDVVTNLSISAHTTSSVSLTWTPPRGQSSSYTVWWTNGTVSNNNTTQSTSYTVTDLTPGVKYTFNVTAVAADNITSGAPVQTSAFTNPDIVTGLTASSTNTSISLTWTPPRGQSPSYTVWWTNGTVSNNNTTQSTSYTVTYLSPGVNYTFNVTAVAADNTTSGAPVQISRFTNPNVVTNLIISAHTTSSVSLTWTPPQGNYSFYTIEWTNGTVSNSTTTPNSTFTVTDLTPGVKYTFNVTAVAADNIISGATVQISTFTIPDVITNLSISAQSTSSVSLTWTPPHGQSSFYTIEWTNGTVSNSTTTPNSSFTVTDLTPGVNYTFNVTAVAADNKTSGAPVQTSAFTKPDIIQNLTVTEITTSSLFINWSGPIGQKSFFKVQWTYGNATSNTTTIQTSYNITNLTAGENYNVCVSAVAGDNSTEGKSVCLSVYTKPDIVQNLTVSNITTSSVLLSWFEPVGRSSYYRVQYGNISMTLNKTSQNTTVTISNLTPGLQYTFSICAVAADNSTEGSCGSITAYTKPDVIQNLTVTEITTSSLFINWSEPIGQRSFFKVQWTYDNVTSNTTTIQTTYNVTNLTAGVNYNVCVSAVAGDSSTEGKSVCLSVYTKPDVIQNLTVTEITTSSLFINWSGPIGQKSFFKVQWTCDNVTSNTTTIQTSYNITNLTAGENYNVCVSAVAGDNSTEGKSVCLSVYTKPDIVQNLTVSNITTSSVLLSWFEPVGRSSYYRVQYGNISMTLNKTSQNTTVTISNLTPGLQYTFSICAVAADNSTEGSCGSITAYTKPDVIQNLTVTEITTSSLFINWSGPIGQRSFFKVQWTYDNVTSNTTTIQTSYNITNLTPGVNYYIRVSAVAADNVTEGDVVPLSRYTNNITEGTSVAFSNYTNTSPVINYTCDGPNRTAAYLDLKWTEPSGHNQGYNISLNTGFSGGTTSSTKYNISNLQYGTPYTVTVTTLGCGQSGMQKFQCRTGFTDVSIADVRNTYDDWKNLKKSYLTVLQQYGNTRSDTIQVTIGNNGYLLNGTNYTNPPLDPNNYRVAIVIFTNLHITNGVVDIYQSFASITPFASITINIPKDPDVIGIVLGVLCVIIILLIIAVIVFIKKRRQREKKDTDIPISNVRSIPVRVEDYEVYFKKQQADSNCGFAEEYEDLKVIGTAQSKSSALAMENKGKNRYNNVLPYDSSRVKLSTHGSPFDDYINANYIAGYNSRKEYIAAQGPLPATVNEFWRMIWEKHVQTIVMLTKCNEQGRVKCEKYWPSETKMYSNIMVTNVSEIALEDWTISDFTIKNVKTAESREVRHFHFTAWPDHGVPETTEVLINFRHLVREHMDQYSRHSPTVVHCSAGVGRTGTFIALDHLIFQIERDSMVDIFGIVYDMRMHRSLMVQTEDQYVFLNQCAVDIIKSRMGTNVDLIYQNAAAFSVYGNVQQQWR
ncbi:hypothetical protein NFI96_018812, partial [Prochilodus magdalenae]